MTHPHERLTSLPAHIDCSSMIPTGLPGAGPFMACPAEDVGLRPDIKFESRVDALRRENRERAEQTEAAMIAADAEGKLWTVQAALYPNRAFCCIYHGRRDDTEPLSSQHQAAGAIFGPVFLIGKTQKEAMIEAMNLFTVQEITIRVIL